MTRSVDLCLYRAIPCATSRSSGGVARKHRLPLVGFHIRGSFEGRWPWPEPARDLVVFRMAGILRPYRWHNRRVTRPFPSHSRIRYPVQPCRGRL